MKFKALFLSLTLFPIFAFAVPPTKPNFPPGATYEEKKAYAEKGNKKAQEVQQSIKQSQQSQQQKPQTPVQKPQIPVKN
jgi:ATP-dependent phosphoenolpyruvate carboxykinase